MSSHEFKDTALIFEGGGMRNSYSSGLVNVLIEYGFCFGSVYGLSAGATNAIDYLSRDTWRSRVSFTEYIDDLALRLPFSLFLQGGVSSSINIRGCYAKANVSIPFDYKTFSENPACLTVQAIERETGLTKYFTNDDFTTEQKLMDCVGASTSFPVIMGPKRIDGHVYYDGGIGEGGGIMLSRARADGFKKYFVVCTRPKGFRKPLKRNYIYDLYFWRYPAMRKALDTWAVRYNAALDELAYWESEGCAYVFYANNQSVSNSERVIAKLTDNFEKGYRQAIQEMPSWEQFLEI